MPATPRLMVRNRAASLPPCSQRPKAQSQIGAAAAPACVDSMTEGAHIPENSSSLIRRPRIIGKRISGLFFPTTTGQALRRPPGYQTCYQTDQENQRQKLFTGPYVAISTELRQIFLPSRICKTFLSPLASEPNECDYRKPTVRASQRAREDCKPACGKD